MIEEVLLSLRPGVLYLPLFSLELHSASLLLSPLRSVEVILASNQLLFALELLKHCALSCTATLSYLVPFKRLIAESWAGSLRTWRLLGFELIIPNLLLTTRVISLWALFTYNSFCSLNSKQTLTSFVQVFPCIILSQIVLFHCYQTIIIFILYSLIPHLPGSGP